MNPPNLPLVFAIALVIFFTNENAAAQWTAYNDCADIDPDLTTENITSYGLGRGYQGDGGAGELLDFETGAPTDVEIEFVETFSTGNTVNWAGDFSSVDEASDAAITFSEKVDLTGNMSYNDAPGWHVDLIITGLNPERSYTFEGTANRGGGASYADRVTNWSILEADTAVYASTLGAHKVSDVSVEFSTGENTVGYVARWTGIQPGQDGKVIIRTTHGVGEEAGGMPGAHAYKGYAGGAFIVREEPSTRGFVWRAFNDSVITDVGLVSENATNFGLGRGFDGTSEGGELLEIDSGNTTGVTVEFVENFSAGNTINTARDFSEFNPETDAAMIFGDHVEASGNLSYNDAPGWYLDLIISNLDPEKTYSFAGTVNRAGGASYADRVTNWSLRDAKASVYASSTGAHKVNDTSVEFSTGENGAGYVARWTDIQPSDDGKITIRTSHGVGEANGGLPGAHAYKGYGGGVFMLGEQSGASIVPVDSIGVSRLAPAPDLQNVHPNAPVEITLEHRSAAVDPSTILLSLNEVNVAPEIIISGDETIIRFTPPTMPTSNSTTNVALKFSDNSEPAIDYVREWSFQVTDYIDQNLYATIPTSWAMPIGGARQRGMAVRVAAPSLDDNVFLETPEDVEAIWAETFENLADLTEANTLGYFIETGTINYQTDLEPRGNKAGESNFPGIQSSFEPGVPFGLEIDTLLLLDPGFHLFNFTVPGDFECFIGFGSDKIKLPRTYAECTNCGGEDGPWFTGVVIEERGLYPFRVVYPNPGSSGSLEWLEVAPDSRRHLINAPNEDSIPAFLPSRIFPVGLRVLSIERDDSLLNLMVETPDSSLTHIVEMSTSLKPNSWKPALLEDTEQISAKVLRIELEMPNQPTVFFRVLIGMGNDE